MDPAFGGAAANSCRSVRDNGWFLFSVSPRWWGLYSSSRFTTSLAGDAEKLS